MLYILGKMIFRLLSTVRSTSDWICSDGQFCCAWISMATHGQTGTGVSAHGLLLSLFNGLNIKKSVTPERSPLHSFHALICFIQIDVYSGTESVEWNLVESRWLKAIMEKWVCLITFYTYEYFTKRSFPLFIFISDQMSSCVKSWVPVASLRNGASGARWAMHLHLAATFSPLEAPETCYVLFYAPFSQSKPKYIFLYLLYLFVSRCI